jgi:hypothetical protein
MGTATFSPIKTLFEEGLYAENATFI